MDIISYILSRKYTDMSIVGLGSIRGANCTVKDIVHQDGINTVTFEWTGTDGTKKTRDMVVYDGTPIYVWESGNTYHYGDLAIYESQFYRCIVENNDAVFDDTKWNEIGSPDGNYDIVQSKALLPARFTAADRKLYFVIDECIFYLWDGYQWVALNHAVQVDSFPTASAKYFGKIYQYIGATTNDYTHGYFYQCVSNGETPAVYSWEYVQTSDIQIATVQKAGIVKPDDETIRVDANGTISVIDRLFVGTQAEWDALTPIQQALYKPIHITDDEEVLDLGVYLRKVKIMPNAEDAPSEFVMYIGANTADYTRGYIYRSVPSVVSGETVYNWVRQDVQPSHPYVQSDWSQNNSSANDYIKNKPTLGTASEKNFTDNVRPNSHDLVESNAVYNAISSSIASIYKPHGDLTCAQLTSDLLIPTNIGNVYNMTDSGTTSALFIQGAGKPIHVNDTVGIIQADNSAVMFNLMGSMLDLHDYQTKELETPLTINGIQETDVEDALGAIADTLENVGRYNVLDYGLKNDFYTDNVEALTDLIDSVEEGAVLYFPAGCYRFTDGIVITKRVAFIGDATTNMIHSTSNNNKPVTQFVYAGSANTTMFTYNGYFGFIVENITFYGGLNDDNSMSYRLIANTDEFTTLPYPYFKEVIKLENVNCLDISSNGHPDDTIKNCVFYGFSGFGLKIQQHKIIANCAFKFCKVGIEMTYTDAMVTDCWFNNCGICVNTTTSSSANIQISNTWADGIGGHFVKSDNSIQCKLLINDVWVDMVDKSAICSEVGYLNKCQISGRFSRCGMMYAGLADADRTNAIKPLADVIYAPRIYDSEIDISIEKRSIGDGNNADGYCPSRVVSATGAFINNCYIHVYDTEYENILGSNANYTEVISKDNHKVEFNIWSYDSSICTFRTNSPIGRASSPRLNAFAYDTTTRKLYRATAINDNTAWEVVTEPTQFSTMPNASATYLGKLVQYIGTTTSTYTHGYFYECVSDGAASPSYSWKNVITQKEIPHYDIMPSNTVLFSLPNNTVFLVDGFYRANDNNGGYYKITSDWVKGCLKIVENGTTKFLVALSNNADSTHSDYVDVCRYGIRPVTSNIDLSTITVENSYAHNNSVILSNIYSVNTGCILKFPRGHFVFEDTIDLSINGKKIGIKGEGEFNSLFTNGNESFLNGDSVTGTVLLFPFLENEECGIKMRTSSLENIVVYGNTSTYNFTIDRTKVVTAPNEVISEIIANDGTNDIHCIGIDSAGGILNSVYVANFYTGITARSNEYVTNAYVYRCHNGIVFGADVKCKGVYGWNIHTFITCSAASISLNQSRVDSCVNAMKLTDYVTTLNVVDFDGDWCTDSLIIVDCNRVSKSNFVNVHGRCNTLKYYDSTQHSEPDVRDLSDTDGYGVIRVINGVFIDNYIVYYSKGAAQLIDGQSRYLIPSIIFTFDIVNSTTINNNNFVINTDNIDVKTDILKYFQTKLGLNARIDTSKATYYLDNIDVTQELQGIEFTAQELSAMW